MSECDSNYDPVFVVSNFGHSKNFFSKTADQKLFILGLVRAEATYFLVCSFSRLDLYLGNNNKLRTTHFRLLSNS